MDISDTYTLIVDSEQEERVEAHLCKQRCLQKKKMVNNCEQWGNKVLCG